MKSNKTTLLPAVTLLTVLLLAFSLSSASSSAATFTDVPSSYWAYSYIEAIYNSGITVGCSQNPPDYCPADNVTRGQMAAFIERSLNGENFTYSQTPFFSDVPAGNVFFKYVQKLKDDGITTVFGTYYVDEDVTRGQMAAFLIRAKYGENFAYTQAPYFSDVPPANIFFKYVQRLKDDGITTVSGAYNVDSYVTRDQMAAFIARAFLGGDGSANNVIPILVNGPSCNSNLNEPCVSVTVCTPGTASCQTIDGILLDTGSFGLRIFKQALTIPLAPEMIGSGSLSGLGSLAECAQFGGGVSLWGPVQSADVVLGNEPAVLVPIQVIDSTFGTIPSSCIAPVSSPADPNAGFNGILGIGPLRNDCGTACESNSFGWYYSCIGPNCADTTVPLASQVQNPVPLLQQDNNGVIVQFPNVPPGGSESLRGNLVLGIGTQSNNMPSSWVNTYQTDQFGDVTTIFNATFYNIGYLDTGSSALFFPSPFNASAGPYAGLLPDCGSVYSGSFCPSITTNLSATIVGSSGSPSTVIPFQIANFDNLISSPNSVFSDIGANDSGEFIWGLPFFFGRDTYIGFEGQQSSLGTGPYVAF